VRHVLPPLVLRGVSRSFGPVRALDSVDLEVEQGSVTVILGPNGAGKTTTFRVVTGVLAPQAGIVEVFGLDPARHGGSVRRRCGVVPPKPAMYDRLTGRENLAYAARLYELDDPPIGPLSERFGIDHALDQPVGAYSTGMRTRLALVRSLLHDPQLLLLDEPTAGLDPESALVVRRLLFDMAHGGRTVVMSTHLLHEADGTADQIVMMDEGRVWERGTPSELAARFGDGTVVRLDAEDRSVFADLAAMPGVLGVRVDGVVEATLSGPAEVPALVAALVERGARLTRVEPVKLDLEALYFRMRRARERSS
jgi:ABC-2 type transport system ATP-binding protein